MAEEFVTHSPGETEAVGGQLGGRLRAGDIVLLTGELGAGKTTLVRGLVRGAGSTDHVASPTFQLLRVYSGPLQIAHVDLYRVMNADELTDLGLDELTEQGALVIEWGDRLDMPEAALVDLEHLGGERRRIRIRRDLRR